MSEMIPIFGMLTGIIIPLAAFFWQYIDGKERRATILEISVAYTHLTLPTTVDG